MSERLEIDPDDVREPDASAPRRRLFPAMFLTFAVAGVAYLSWWTYEHAKPPQIASSVPVIHSDAAPVKEVPKNPGGMIVPDQDSALLNRDNKAVPKVEQLLPEPETALPRPAPAPKPALQPDAALAPARPTPPVASAPAPVLPPPAPIAAAPSVPAPAPLAAVPPPPSASMPTIAPPAAAAPAGSASYRLQLGAVRSEDAAKQEWQRLQKAQPDLLGKLSVAVVRADLGEKGVFYRIQAGPIGDAAEATQSCAALKSRNVGCILVKP
jgi:cell division septation protein DedD